MKRVAARMLPWGLGLAAVMLSIAAVASTTRNLTIDIQDRVLLRVWAGAAWFIRNDEGYHGDPGSQVYLHRSDQTHLALTSLCKVDREKYREWGMPVLWLAGACAAGWVWAVRRSVMDPKRRWSFVLRGVCVVGVALVVVTLVSLRWVVRLSMDRYAIHAQAGAIGLTRTDSGSRVALETERFLWDDVSPNVRVPWFSNDSAAAAASAGSAPASGFVMGPGASLPRGMVARSTSPTVAWKSSLPLIVPIGMLGLAGWWVRRRVLRQGANCCKQCLYDLTGLPAGAVCPECGKAAATAPIVASGSSAAR